MGDGVACHTPVSVIALVFDAWHAAMVLARPGRAWPGRLCGAAAPQRRAGSRLDRQVEPTGEDDLWAGPFRAGAGSTAAAARSEERRGRGAQRHARAAFEAPDKPAPALPHGPMQVEEVTL